MDCWTAYKASMGIQSKKTLQVIIPKKTARMPPTTERAVPLFRLAGERRLERGALWVC